MLFKAKDREKLDTAKEKIFIDNCINEFVEPSVITGNKRKVKNLLTWSYLPNLVSIITATFFIIYLLEAYTLLVRVFLIALLLIVAVSIEYGKRALISETGKTYFLTEKLPGGLFSGVIVLMIVSMTVSFMGGQKLVTTTATPPAKVVNPKIDSLNNLLRAELNTIEKLKQTTWKGRIVENAQLGLLNSQKVQSSLLAQISEIERSDNDAHEIKLAESANKIQNFGFVLGGVAVLADLVLFFLLWTVKKLKHEIVLLNVPITNTRTNVSTPQTQTIGFSHNSTPQTQPVTPGRTLMGFKQGTRTPLTEEVEYRQPTKKIMVCLHCGKDFIKNVPHHKYCSERCRKAAWEEKTGKKLKV